MSIDKLFLICLLIVPLGLSIGRIIRFSLFLYIHRLITLQAELVRVVSMIPKIRCQCVTNAPIIIRIYEEIDVHHVNISIFSHLFRLVNVKMSHIFKWHSLFCICFQRMRFFF